MKRRILTCVFILMIVSGCSRGASYERPEAEYAVDDAWTVSSAPSTAGSGGSNDYDAKYALSQDSLPVPAPSVAPDISVPSQYGLIFIKTANVSLTSPDFDFSVAELKNIVAAYGGFFENSNMFNYLSAKVPYKRLTATIRVPAERYEFARQAVESLGKHVSTNESSREVSSEYYDLESRINTKKTEEIRLLALIEQATELDQLINLERRLGEVRTDIEIYGSRLKQIDSLASYSTINIEIKETPEGYPREENDFFKRLRDGFSGSVTGTLNVLQGIVIFLAYLSVPAVLAGLLALVALFIYRRAFK